MQRDAPATGEPSRATESLAEGRGPKRDEGGSTAGQFIGAVLVTATSGIICGVGQRHFVLADSIMIHVLGVVLASARFGVAASVVTAGLGVLSFDFFFLPPLLKFNVPDFRSALTFVSMSVVALVISRINQRLRQSERAARREQARTASLYAMTRDLAAARTTADIASVAQTHLERIVHAPVVILLPDEGGLLTSSAGPNLNDAETAVALRIWGTCFGSEAWSVEAEHTFVPMQGTHEKMGMLVVRRGSLGEPASAELQELRACAQQLAIALDRATRSRDVERAHVQVETERMRGALLSAISHDLRTPLTAILTAGTTLSQDDAKLSSRTRTALAGVIVEETERLSALVTNLLSMTRLESGQLHIKKIAEPLEDVLGAALHRLDGRLGERPLTVEIPRELPLVGMDAMLIEQLLLNLLENALRYSPAGSPLDLRMCSAAGSVELEIADRGVGLVPGEESKVFEKFYRGAGAVHGDGGAGLGLTICEAIVHAHGGRIAIRNREGGGATVQVSLPALQLALEPSLLPELLDREMELS